jgi:hypothetical protein
MNGDGGGGCDNDDYNNKIIIMKSKLSLTSVLYSLYKGPDARTIAMNCICVCHFTKDCET